MKFLVLSFFVIAAASAASPDADAPILKQAIDVGTDGSYQWNFETGNGIVAQEQGALKNAGSPNEAASVQGSAQWNAPDGTPVQFSYLADENGFQPQGSHIPTPPPVPEAILRALEWIKAHPAPEEHQKKF